LRLRIHASPNVGGVGEGRKAAAEPWSLGGSPSRPVTYSCLTRRRRAAARVVQ
jgi:hypothetical protein